MGGRTAGIDSGVVNAVARTFNFDSSNISLPFSSTAYALLSPAITTLAWRVPEISATGVLWWTTTLVASPFSATSVTFGIFGEHDDCFSNSDVVGKL